MRFGFRLVTMVLAAAALLTGCGVPGGSVFGPRLSVAANGVGGFTYVGVAGTFTAAELHFTVENTGLQPATGLTFSAVVPAPAGSPPTAGTSLTVNPGTCTGDLAPEATCQANLVLDGLYTGDAVGSFTVSSNGGSVSRTTPVQVDIIVIGP